MKKTILKTTAVLFACLSAQTVSAQKLYATIQGGYGLGSGVSTANSVNILETYTGTNTSELTAVKLALGKGVNFGATIGTMLHKNIGLELGLGYLIGGKSKIGEIDGANYSTYDFSGNFLNIKPSLMLQLPLKDMSVYSKFGVLATIGNVNTHAEEKDGNSLNVLHLKSSGGFGLGFTSALGLNLRMNNQTSLLLEINNTNATFSPAKDEAVEFTMNGANKLGDLNTSQKETEYVSKLVQTNTSPSASAPRQELKPAYALGNTSFNIGLRFSF
jgi:Outer membrane protein beta-barrel domain